MIKSKIELRSENMEKSFGEEPHLSIGQNSGVEPVEAPLDVRLHIGINFILVSVDVEDLVKGEDFRTDRHAVLLRNDCRASLAASLCLEGRQRTKPEIKTNK